MATVSYTRMADMTDSDLRLIDADGDEDARRLPGRLMQAVADLERFQGALKVTRLEHSLQSATRAHRAGKDKEYVAAALLHDIGDALAPHSHGDLVAAVLKPFVSERVCWIVQKHALFQAYYYAHLMGEDRNARDRYIDHPYFDDCVEFCEHFDQTASTPTTTHCRSSSPGRSWTRCSRIPATRPTTPGSAQLGPAGGPAMSMRPAAG